MKLSKRLQLLADYCEAQGPDKFSFHNWVSAGRTGPSPCGTVCCLLGHSPGAFKDEPEWARLWFSLDNEVAFNVHDAKALLEMADMTDEEMDCAFYPDYQEVFWGDGTPDLTSNSSLEDAVANLRRLAKYIQEDG